jgi:hypothetical protein
MSEAIASMISVCRGGGSRGLLKQPRSFEERNLKDGALVQAIAAWSLGISSYRIEMRQKLAGVRTRSRRSNGLHMTATFGKETRPLMQRNFN